MDIGLKPVHSAMAPHIVSAAADADSGYRPTVLLSRRCNGDDKNNDAMAIHGDE